MTESALIVGSSVTLPKSELNLLMADLREKGYQTVGPRLQDESIVYGEITSLDDLSRGINSDQGPASYRITHSTKNRYFDFIPGGQSWKQFLFPSQQTLFSAVKDGSWKLIEPNETAPRYALIGVRACELAAIHIQDKVFLREDFKDPSYRAKREGLFILGVNCLDPDDTCFCTSMGTGPRLFAGYDLCLTELEEVFLLEVGSELGRALLTERSFNLPSAFVQESAKHALDKASKAILRKLEISDLPDLLTGNLEAERWTEVANRCLSCGNCTQVCPTCFCWNVIDHVNISGTSTRRERVWDSCFSLNYSYMAGGNTRPSVCSRYRQWLTHKLGTWVEQFGMLGCVGCGRCISWCPAGIDLTEEVAAIRAEVNT
jgi:sulfhydrogenase subunit beta (sulfur reductase)